MAKFTDLPVILASTPITDAHVFAVATSTTTEQLSLTELQKSMTGLIARVDSFSIIGKTVPSGLTVGDNGLQCIQIAHQFLAIETWLGSYLLHLCQTEEG